MSILDAVEAELWSAQVKQQYQQMVSATKGTMRFKEAGKGFKEVHFSKYSAGFARDVPAAGGDGQPMNLKATPVTIPLVAKYADEYTWWPSNNHIAFDDRTQIQKAQAGAMARAFDTQTFDALSGSGAAVVGDGTLKATYETMTAIVKQLEDKNAFNENQLIVWLITPQIQKDLMNDEFFINNDYIQRKFAERGTLRGSIVQGLTFKVIADFSVTSGDITDKYGLPKVDPTNRRSFVYTFDSMGQAIGSEITSTVETNIKPKFGALVRSLYDMGVGVIDKDGVVEVQTLIPS